jgi:hypothetical protein
LLEFLRWQIHNSPHDQRARYQMKLEVHYQRLQMSKGIELSGSTG